MVLISKIAGALLVPPGLFLLLFIFALVLVFLRRQRSGSIVALATILLIYILSIAPGQNALLSPLEKRVDTPSEEQLRTAEYVVVLGGGTAPARAELDGSGGADRSSSSSYSENFRPSPDFLSRLVHGVRLSRKYELPIIVSGGMVFPDEYDRAGSHTAEHILLDLGVAADKIILEDQSRNTRQNATYTARIVEKSPVILVTSAVHMRRSLFSFRKAGVEAYPSPSGYKYEAKPYDLRDFLPSSGALHSSSAALHEYFGLLYYFLRSLLP